VKEAARRFSELSSIAADEYVLAQKARASFEAKSRALRSEVEQSVAGAGAIARRVTQIRTDIAQLLSRKRLVEDRQQRLRHLRARRDDRISQLDAVRTHRYELRTQAAKRLSSALKPQIKVKVERAGQYEAYATALTEALKGSGLRYNELAKVMSERVPPHELVTMIDNDDYIGLSNITSIPKDRSARVISFLRGTSPADVVTAPVEDDVRMTLLDGVDYKDIEHLSAGQRCTVVLSVILQHADQTLVIDQPEDHLDNAYIANTVVKSLLRTRGRGQVILSTHNPNIPVLGRADLIIELTSDGRNGFVEVCEGVEHPAAVNAITTVMEGGREAFLSRAQFYDDHNGI
jgi:ATPase subunit of ABC transporter with duplicated ATPase domains